jgi:hypothetical protein
MQQVVIFVPPDAPPGTLVSASKNEHTFHVPVPEGLAAGETFTVQVAAPGSPPPSPPAATPEASRSAAGAAETSDAAAEASGAAAVEEERTVCGVNCDLCPCFYSICPEFT